MTNYELRIADNKLSVSGIKYGVLLCLWLLAGTAVHAQDFKSQYKHAKDLYEDKKYNLAMEAFKPLIIYDSNNPYSEYASFFYSASAYHQGYLAIAKDNLLQLKKLHADWDQMDEVNYWLAKIYFDEREYFQALLVLKSIKSPSFQEDIKALTQNYLTKIDDAETLRMLLEENPDNAVVGYALTKAISRQTLFLQDAALFESLITKFNLDRNEFESNVKPRSIKKDRYRVSLLFPFLTKSLEPTVGVKSNQFVIDLYEGMKMAVDTLSKQGIAIDLLAYDTDRNVETLSALLKTDELKSTDLVVGPFFAEEAKVVQEFSMTHQINMINPVSNNSAVFVGENPFGMLFQPSYETLGLRSAEYAANKVKNKNCIVFFGDAPKDSVMAFSFIRKALDLGMKVVHAEEIMRDGQGRIQPLLSAATEYDEFKRPTKFKLKKDSVGSIFVASDNALIYSKVISSVQVRSDSIQIIGSENWIANETSVNYDILDRLSVIMASPNYVGLHNPNYVAFRKKYVARHGQLPSLYARMGFEFMDFIGKAMYQYGVYYQDGISQAGFIRGSLCPGYSFPTARDNQYVPFARVKGGELVIVESGQK